MTTAQTRDAIVAEMREYADTSDGCQYGTISTRLLRDFADRLAALPVGDASAEPDTFRSHDSTTLIARSYDTAPPPSVPALVSEAARYFKEQGGHIGGLGASRAANILWDYINGVLAARPDAPAGEKGGEWVLVPREPTTDMELAGCEAGYDHEGEDEAKVAVMYRAMLAATPPPPRDAGREAQEASRYRWLRKLKSGRPESQIALAQVILALREKPEAMDAFIDEQIATDRAALAPETGR